MKKILANYIPVSVYTKGKEKTWYINIDKLSLSELFELRKELLPYSGVSIRSLDKVILSETDSYYKYKKEPKQNYRNAKIRHRKSKNGR